MPRSKGQRSDSPAYRYHVSGQARVTLDGVDFYLGEHASPQSWARYYQLLAEYHAAGKKAPDKPKHQKDEPIRVAAVTALFRHRVDEIYANNKNQHQRFNNLCDLLEYEYGDLPAKKFGPRHLKEIRAHFVADGNCRRYVNEQTLGVKKIFEYAGNEGDIIKPKVASKLAKVENVRKGQRVPEAGNIVPPESTKRPTVDLEYVRATAEYLSPTLKAMVIIQTATGMRPSEVCKMTPGEVDRGGDVWVYCVMDAVCRSNRPIESATIEFDFPLWSVVGDVTPSLKTPKTRGSVNQERKDDEADAAVRTVMQETNDWMSRSTIGRRAGLGPGRVDRALFRLRDELESKEDANPKNKNSTTDYFRLKNEDSAGQDDDFFN